MINQEEKRDLVLNLAVLKIKIVITLREVKKSLKNHLNLKKKLKRINLNLIKPRFT